MLLAPHDHDRRRHGRESHRAWRGRAGGYGSTARLRSRTTHAFLFRCFWIPHDAEPDAGAPAFEAARQVLEQPLGLACFQKIVPEYDSKSIIERQERSEHVDLIQRESPFEPFLRILEREMDVMDVDEHSSGKARERLEDQPVDIAAYLGHVGAVDQQYVAGSQLKERINADRMNAIDDHLAPLLIVGTQQRPQPIR